MVRVPSPPPTAQYASYQLLDILLDALLGPLLLVRRGRQFTWHHHTETRVSRVYYGVFGVMFAPSLVLRCHMSEDKRAGPEARSFFM